MPAVTGKSLLIACALNLLLLPGLVPEAASQPSGSAAGSAPVTVVAPAEDASPDQLTPADSAVRRSETVAKLHTDLDTLAKKIEEVKIGIGRAGAKVKQKTREDLAALERTRAAIAARLDSLGGATADAWVRLKLRAGRQMDSLRADIDRVKKKAKG
ncbi:MAG: hypothetical protein ABIW76_05935 [Fibrobacteria bacterium]